MSEPDTYEVVPVRVPLRASVVVPGSKSLTNRALAIAALASGETTIRGALVADDSRYFAAALRQLGFEVSLDEEAATVRVRGEGGTVPAEAASLFVGNAGTAARFLTAMATLGRGEYVIDGVERMRQRPIAGLIEGLRQLGADMDCPTGCPPVRVRGKGLRGGKAVVTGDVSSQFASALLMAAPMAEEPCAISIAGRLNSAPYVEMTLGVMSDFGIEVERVGEGAFRVPVGRYVARNEYHIEADASAASYFFAAAAVTGGTVRVENMPRRSRQGDTGFLDVLTAMGCKVDEREGGVEVSGARVLRGVDVDLSDTPDVAQTLAAVAPFAVTPTVVRGIESARLKECDRISATCAELSGLRVRILERPDGFVIHPSPAIQGTRVRSWGDHRMAMALAIVGLKVPGVVIDGASAVSKTFPRFFRVLETLGGCPRNRRTGPREA
ncbi:MAG: 3-phosphoshikimate 1-carboxyvinyltransferase [Vicinamibacterales bacterium]